MPLHPAADLMLPYVIVSGMSLLRAFALALLFPLAATGGEDLLVLTFSQAPAPSGRVYGSTAAATLPTLSVVDGQRVTLQKFSGSDYRLQAAPLSRAATQVQEIARDATTVSVMPQLQGDAVTVEVSYHLREGTESVPYSSTVRGELGEWIPLLQHAAPGADGSRTYVAGDVRDQLSVRVDRAR